MGILGKMIYGPNNAKNIRSRLIERMSGCGWVSTNQIHTMLGKEKLGPALHEALGEMVEDGTLDVREVRNNRALRTEFHLVVPNAGVTGDELAKRPR